MLRGSTTRTARISMLLAFVTLATVGCIAAGQVPRHHPLVPALSFKLPDIDGGASKAAASSVGHGRLAPLGGSSFAADPSTYTLHGQTASTNGLHIQGKVVLRGRWNHGAWLVLATTRTDAAGNFRVTSHLRRRGLLELRLLLPDGFVGTKTLHVR